MKLSKVLSALPERPEELKILVVDDEPISIRSVYELFKEQFEVLMANSGEQALKQAREHLPDIILLDVRLPDMDGYNVCKALQAEPETQHIPVIFLTALNGTLKEAAAFTAGAVDFITKPVDPVTLQARVETHLALKLQYDFLQNMALIDGLTGVSNRRRFDEELKLAWRLCLRESRPLSLLLIDLDHFKQFNDDYGHLAGDECLRTVATKLKDTLRRPGDIFCRYGGEEFACILTNTKREDAITRAIAMQEAIQDLKIPHDISTNNDYLTCSIGIATLIPDPQTEVTTLIETADKALYKAKNDGRARYAEA